MPELRLGVLAIQGGFEAHANALRGLGAGVREVRGPVDLEGLDGLVIPGGESTTISMGIESAGLEEPIRAHREAGGTVFGTCAGMIVCDDSHLGLIDATATRNAFGRQRRASRRIWRWRESATSRCEPSSSARPGSSDAAPDVGVLASYEGHPVAIREGGVLCCAFHPELTDDPRLHAYFMAMTTSARNRAREEAGA